MAEFEPIQPLGRSKIGSAGIEYSTVAAASTRSEFQRQDAAAMQIFCFRPGRGILTMESGLVIASNHFV
jgi:hypothetical protein